MGIVPFLRHILFPPTIVDGSEALPSAKPVRLAYLGKLMRLMNYFHRAASHRYLWSSWPTHLCSLYPRDDPHQDR